MTTIVVNTKSGAVTEYDWAPQSMTSTRAGGAAGLFSLAGDTDAGAPIAGQFLSGRPPTTTPSRPGNVYLTMQGADGMLLVQGDGGSWEYPVLQRPSGIARATPGVGIRETALALGFRNVDGADFRIERIDAELFPSKTRRA